MPKKFYYHTFKHLLRAHYQRCFMPKSWVVENPGIGIFPHWTYNESGAAAIVVRRVMSVRGDMNNSRERNQSATVIQRVKEERARNTESQKSSSFSF